MKSSGGSKLATAKPVQRERFEVHKDPKYGGVRIDVIVGGKVVMSCDDTVFRRYVNDGRRALAECHRLQHTSCVRRLSNARSAR